jgi:hypothetical protein
MELLLRNKSAKGGIESVTISLNANENVTKFSLNGNEEQVVKTPLFLANRDAYGFEHPLLDEETVQVHEGKAEFFYQSREELFVLPAKILASFIYHSTDLEQIKVAPANDYPLNAKRTCVQYAPTANSKKNQGLDIESFEKLIQKISKQDRFQYYNDFIFNQVVRFEDLNESIDADLLYTGEKDIFLKSLAQEEPIAIRYVSASVGHGAFATRDLKKGEILGIYTGEILLKPRSPIFTMWLGNPVFSLRVDAEFYGNLTRFINHADKKPEFKVDPFYPKKDPKKDILLPNCIYQGHSLFGFNFVTVKASRDIKKDEQLLVYYGNEYWGKKAKYYLTKRNRVICVAEEKNAWIQAPRRADYLLMAQFGVKHARGLLLFRPLIGIFLSIIALGAVHYLL